MITGSSIHTFPAKTHPQASLIPPSGGRYHRIAVAAPTDGVRALVRLAARVAPSHSRPSLLRDTPERIEVEYWTNDMEMIDLVAREFSEVTGLPVERFS